MKPVAALIVGISLLLSGQSVAQTPEEIVWISEQYPPFNYLDESNTPHLKKSLQDIRFYPWGRAYAMAQDQKNICLFSMGYTKEREIISKAVYGCNKATNPKTILLFQKALNDLEQAGPLETIRKKYVN